jgi:hypothetical protein
MITNELRLPWTVLSIAIMSVLLSCDDDDMDPPDDMCDATDVSFMGDVVPILEAHCYNGCHNGATPVSGFVLTSYTAVKVKVDEGRLCGAVSHDAGFVPMPDLNPKLEDCKIDKICSWIDEGAMNN